MSGLVWPWKLTLGTLKLVIPSYFKKLNVRQLLNIVNVLEFKNEVLRVSKVIWIMLYIMQNDFFYTRFFI
jgi:hypothetical protein